MSMGAKTDETLLPETARAELAAEAHRRVAALPERASRYQILVELARIHQELGNQLSKLVYEKSRRDGRPKLACKSGCSTCCLVPSKVRGNGLGYYMLTILDIVTLVENYAAIKRGIGNLLERTAAALKTARAKRRMVPCPYLAPGGACGIYDHRPVGCKLWFSADLRLCNHYCETDYPGPGVSPLADASNSLREEAEAPVTAYAEALLGGAPFGDYDYLTVFHALAQLDSLGQLETLKARIDDGTLSRWNPFESGG